MSIGDSGHDVRASLAVADPQLRSKLEQHLALVASDGDYRAIWAAMCEQLARPPDQGGFGWSAEPWTTADEMHSLLAKLRSDLPLVDEYVSATYGLAEAAPAELCVRSRWDTAAEQLLTHDRTATSETALSEAISRIPQSRPIPAYANDRGVTFLIESFPPREFQTSENVLPSDRCRILAHELGHFKRRTLAPRLTGDNIPLHASLVMGTFREDIRRLLNLSRLTGLIRPWTPDEFVVGRQFDEALVVNLELGNGLIKTSEDPASFEAATRSLRALMAQCRQLRETRATPANAWQASWWNSTPYYIGGPFVARANALTPEAPIPPMVLGFLASCYCPDLLPRAGETPAVWLARGSELAGGHHLDVSALTERDRALLEAGPEQERPPPGRQLEHWRAGLWPLANNELASPRVVTPHRWRRDPRVARAGHPRIDEIGALTAQW